MFGSDILEVAIGMVFLYLFMSMIASALREALEAFLQQRAKLLERGLKEMLRSGTDEQWVKDFYNHPVISSLYKGEYGSKANRAKLPSYIPNENFSLAILDIAAKASEAGALLSIGGLKSRLEGMNSPNAVQRVVLTAIATAGNDLAGVRKHLEDWYDATMQRITGWYARQTGIFLFVIGLGAAVALNVDSITVAKSLIMDRPLRQAVVAQAETYVRDKGGTPQKQTFDELRTEFAEIGYPIGWAMPADGGMYPAPQACDLTEAGFRCAVTGWRLGGVWALAAMGWLITAIAIMLGAPFWFDLLNQLVSLRSALKPPEDRSKKGKTK